jgi:PmbA protein
MRMAVSGTSLSIDIRKGALEQAERSEGVEIGLRVLMGRRQACVSASDISATTIRASGGTRRQPWRARHLTTPYAGLGRSVELAAQDLGRGGA